MICRVCETPWKLNKPLLYHAAEDGRKNSWHCNEYKCSQGCEECRDDFIAIGADVEKKRNWGITLGEKDINIAKKYGAARCRNNRLMDTTDKKMGNQDGLGADINSMGGEIAAARVFKVEPDLTTTPRKGGWDIIINGKATDVKTTTYPDGRLLAIKSKINDPCEIYILVRGTLPRYVLSGWCYGKELFVDENIRTLGVGDTYVLPNNKLRNMDELC